MDGGRFRVGRSGNPGGRPRAAEKAHASAFDIVIGRTLTVAQGGVRRALTVDEALQLKTYQEAIAGNGAARREILKMIAKRERVVAARSVQALRIERIIEPTEPREADGALLILGIARIDERWAIGGDCYRPGGGSADNGSGGSGGRDGGGDDAPRRLVLEPWAVTAAERRGGMALTAEGSGE